MVTAFQQNPIIEHPDESLDEYQIIDWAREHESTKPAS